MLRPFLCQCAETSSADNEVIRFWSDTESCGLFFFLLKLGPKYTTYNTGICWQVAPFPFQSPHFELVFHNVVFSLKQKNEEAVCFCREGLVAVDKPK